MDRTEFETALRRDGFRVVNASLTPNMKVANHCHDFDARTVHHGDGQIGRRAAEHVGEERDSLTGIHPCDGGDDVAAALFHIILGSDIDCLDVGLGSDHMFQCRAKFGRKPPMGHKDDTDHREAANFCLCVCPGP